ncbi:copper chaperone PCu(A)C [Rhodovarius crocodyli]|uniref:Copper chaperone PCu(A)C n=1 Tax=Rhodovarius crocodyli TaxID=1979269 RepID=A0A437MMQ0_9PROT|nr:copper chaperone PCu(A)C [Rhodovarius crocodyli]RVT98935.1 copper chaperone PCu(A)C [Rhodovarius crocodyli]
MTTRRLLLGATLLAPLAAQAQTPAVTVESPWTRAARAGGQGAGFLTLRSAAGDRLLSASSPAANRVELHTHMRDGDVMRMRPVENIELPAGTAVTLQPGGNHLMFIGLKQPFEQGAQVPVTLVFERAGSITVQLPVQGAGARHSH